MHPGKRSFRQTGRRPVRREARSTWVGVLWSPVLFSAFGRGPSCSVQLPRSELLRRHDSWGLWIELEAKNRGERVKYGRRSGTGNWLFW